MRPGRKPSPNRREAGFTLMEMLVVLVIIGLIAAVAAPQAMRLMEGAKHKAARIQVETLLNGLNAYMLDAGTYPATADGLNSLWADKAGNPQWNGPYIRRPQQLIDPWGRAFHYRSPGETMPFELVTYGADGKPGGRGDNADLSAAD